MSAYDRQRLFSILLTVVMTLFVSGNLPYVGRWRRQLRIASIVVFVLALVVALVEVIIWLAGLYDKS